MKHLTIITLALALSACGSEVVYVQPAPTTTPTTVEITAPPTTAYNPTGWNDRQLTVDEFNDWRLVVSDSTDATIQYALGQSDLLLMEQTANAACDALERGVSYDEIMANALDSFDTADDALAIVGLSAYTCLDTLDLALSAVSA